MLLKIGKGELRSKGLLFALAILVRGAVSIPCSFIGGHRNLDVPKRPTISIAHELIRGLWKW